MVKIFILRFPVRSFECSFNKPFKNDKFFFDFTDEQLLSICLDFFQAGTETTSNTLSFGLMYMIHNRRVCDNVQAELDAVIGRKRHPILQDRSHLPYVEAVLSEIMRISNVAPLGIAHRTIENTQFREYLIPKDTVMLVSLYSLNMDKGYWKDPENFRPERFINDNGEYIPHAEQFFPFGLGEANIFNIKTSIEIDRLFFSFFEQANDVAWVKIWPKQAYFCILQHLCMHSIWLYRMEFHYQILNPMME